MGEYRRMARTEFIEHQGRRIVFMNLAGLESTGEALLAIEEARKFVAAQPRRRELLVLTDVTGSIQDAPAVEAMKALAAHDKPWVLAGAVVGVSAMKRMAMKMVLLFSGRKVGVFATQQQAKDWLVQQWVPPLNVPDAAA